MNSIGLRGPIWYCHYRHCKEPPFHSRQARDIHKDVRHKLMPSVSKKIRNPDCRPEPVAATDRGKRGAESTASPGSSTPTRYCEVECFPEPVITVATKQSVLARESSPMLSTFTECNPSARKDRPVLANAAERYDRASKLRRAPRISEPASATKAEIRAISVKNTRPDEVVRRRRETLKLLG